MAKSAEQKQLGGDRLVSKNRRAHFNYEIGDTYEAGLVLIGSEVRSLREQGADLTDAWVDIEKGEAWVKGMRIPPLKHAAFGHEERRKRKLLLHAEQIVRLQSAKERDGMTLIVTKCYFKSNRAKIEVGVARGKKKHDKRQTLREREADREARAAISRARKG
ncbi:MAG: SsrA-binding protein SmpB [Myxococcales bacterium]|nr:SsrA-binding protein SmpB [Myxococcales bacterium]MCB9581765.1 SsrA-binding protein SmpB [Polyangiaceae bacterium]